MAKTIHMFTKPGCSFCTRAKKVLQQLGEHDLRDYDVTASLRNANAVRYFSGVFTVPQILLGPYHINGAEDLERLQTTQHLSKLMQTTPDTDFKVDALSDDELAKGAED